MRWTKMIAILFLAGAVALILSCSSDITNPASSGLQVYITDAPIDLSGVSAVNVTFTGMVLYPGDDESGSTDLDLSPVVLENGGTINLLDYRDGAVILAASGDIPAGTYNRLRLLVSQVTVMQDDDGDPATPEIEDPVFMPSGKIDVHFGFTVAEGEEADVILDFDAGESVHLNETGSHKYILRPVVNHVSTTVL